MDFRRIFFDIFHSCSCVESECMVEDYLQNHDILSLMNIDCGPGEEPSFNPGTTAKITCLVLLFEHQIQIRFFFNICILLNETVRS